MDFLVFLGLNGFKRTAGKATGTLFKTHGTKFHFTDLVCLQRAGTETGPYIRFTFTWAQNIVPLQHISFLLFSSFFLLRVLSSYGGPVLRRACKIFV